MVKYAKEYATYYKTIGLSFEEAYSSIFGKKPTK